MNPAVFYELHLCPEMYKMPFKLYRDIMKVNIYMNTQRNFPKFCSFQHFTSAFLPSLSGGQMQSVGLLG